MNCRNCSGTDLQLVLDLGLQPWGNDFITIKENRPALTYPLQLFYCADCSMVQIGYTIPKEILFVDHNYMSGTTRSLSLHFRMVADRILSRIDVGPGQYVLDIGGNDGTFLKAFRELGIQVLNVDSGRKQAARSNANGIPCINTFFNEKSAADILSKHGPAKVIHGSGIFFHLEELHGVFEGIKHLLAPDGVLVAEFIYLPQMVQQCAFDQIYHEHMVYYSLATLSDLLGRHELSIRDCEFAPIHGGSCIAYAGHPSAGSASLALLASLDVERRAGMMSIDPYLDFARRAVLLRDELRGIVSRLRGEGRKIATLGAPVKGTTIVNYCGWTEKDIQFATELNELKCGTYVPGTRIPVVHQDRSERPDVYVLLSWNFKEEILARISDFRRSGGRVLVPIPKAELI
jgi:hypothetical protein